MTKNRISALLAACVITTWASAATAVRVLPNEIVGQSGSQYRYPLGGNAWHEYTIVGTGPYAGWIQERTAAQGAVLVPDSSSRYAANQVYVKTDTIRNNVFADGYLLGNNNCSDDQVELYQTNHTYPGANSLAQGSYVPMPGNPVAPNSFSSNMLDAAMTFTSTLAQAFEVTAYRLFPELGLIEYALEYFGGGGGGCFIAGTSVAMADGTMQAIETIRPGQIVLSYDLSTEHVVAAAVEEVFVHPYDGSGMVTINDQVVATVNHPFFANGGFVRADDLAMSDSLLTLPQTFSAGDDYAMSLVPGAIVTLTSTGDLTPARVYNLAVREHHTYFAGGILVHNMIYKY